MILLELFWVFFLIGAFTFGGGYAMIAMIQQQVVSRGWMATEPMAYCELGLPNWLANTSYMASATSLGMGVVAAWSK